MRCLNVLLFYCEAQPIVQQRKGPKRMDLPSKALKKSLKIKGVRKVTRGAFFIKLNRFVVTEILFWPYH